MLTLPRSERGNAAVRVYGLSTFDIRDPSIAVLWHCSDGD